MAKASKDEIAEFLASEFVKVLVGSTAYRLHQMMDKPCPDEEDIEQELLVHLMKELPKQNPQRGNLFALANKVVNSRKWNILRFHNAQKRNNRRVKSTDDDFAPNARFCEDAVPEGRFVVEEQQARKHKAVHHRGQMWYSSLQHDLELVMKDLSPVLLDLAVRLMHESPTEISEDTGVPLSTISDRQKQILKVFERSGLRKYR
jgi:hypothetical protein